MSSVDIVHIIDDDPIICDVVRTLLSAEGFETRTYTSALEFLKKIEFSGGRCVVSDVHMPKMTGIELLAKLKQFPSAPPVILMTGRDDISPVQAIKAGAVGFLQKPFSPDHLIASVRLAAAETEES